MMSEDDSIDPTYTYRMPDLNVPDPPPELSYGEMEDFLNREILKANGVSLSEDALLAALKHEDGIIQAAAAHVLASMSSKAATADLKQLLSSTNELVKVEAAYALARLGAPEGRETLVECLGYPLNASICAPLAAGYLAKLGDPQGYGVVVRCFDIEILAIRMLACKQLFYFLPFNGKPDGSGQTADVFALYERALKDSSADVQWQALVQMREIRSPELKRILESYIATTSDESLRMVAKGILESIASTE